MRTTLIAAIVALWSHAAMPQSISGGHGGPANPNGFGSSYSTCSYWTDEKNGPAGFSASCTGDQIRLARESWERTSPAKAMERIEKKLDVIIELMKSRGNVVTYPMPPICTGPICPGTAGGGGTR